MPTVSVIIPTYNRANFVCEAIDSVLAQTYQDLEIIVVDDGSTDGTEQKVSRYVSGVRYIRQENSGSAIARNRGILASHGKYVAFLDSDDLWLATKLAKQVSILDDESEMGLVYSDCVCGTSINHESEGFFGKHSPPSGHIFERLVQANYIWTSGVLVRRDVLADSGLFDPTLRRSQDWDLWLRIAYATKCVYIDEILGLFREHEGRITKDLGKAEAVCRAFELQTCRWKFLPTIANEFRKSTGTLYAEFAWAFRQ